MNRKIRKGRGVRSCSGRKRFLGRSGEGGSPAANQLLYLLPWESLAQGLGPTPQAGTETIADGNQEAAPLPRQPTGPAMQTAASGHLAAPLRHSCLFPHQRKWLHFVMAQMFPYLPLASVHLRSVPGVENCMEGAGHPPAHLQAGEEARGVVQR